MQSDALFYELFQTAPQIFFELVQITPTCAYRFESITVKTAEKRIDGVLEPTQIGQPTYFLEVQAFPDEVIYWRLMREVATYFEQRPERKDEAWQAIVLWLDKNDDPGFGTLTALSTEISPKLVSAGLRKLLEKLGDQSLALNVLRPFTVDNEYQVRQNLPQWVENIHHIPGLTPDAEERLLTVLLQLIEQRFPHLSYKELSQMLQLTPFKETQSYRETVHEDFTTTLLRHIKRKYGFGERTLTQLARRFDQLRVEDLQTLFEDILEIKTLSQLNEWLDAHTTNESNPIREGSA